MSIFDQEIMARTAIGEARGEGDAGMLAVMWAGMNRFTSKKWFAENTVAGTFLKKEQFDCWNWADPNYEIISDINDSFAIYRDAIALASQVLLGTIADPTGGATHYANLSVCNPAWVAGAEQTAVIGKHTFFKNVA